MILLGLNYYYNPGRFIIKMSYTTATTTTTTINNNMKLHLWLYM